MIEGIPYAMSPLPVPKHQRIAVKLSSKFDNSLGDCRCAVYQPIDYLIGDDTILQPDMLVVCGEIKKKFLDFPPALVVEILSPSTALKDRHTKYSIYESQKVKYYIIVSPDTEEVEVFELEDDAYALKQKGKAIVHAFSFEECSAAVNFGDIW